MVRRKNISGKTFYPSIPFSLLPSLTPFFPHFFPPSLCPSVRRAWYDHMMTWWHDDMIAWWLDDMMTWWHDDMMTWWHDDIWHDVKFLRPCKPTFPLWKSSFFIPSSPLKILCVGQIGSRPRGILCVDKIGSRPRRILCVDKIRSCGGSPPYRVRRARPILQKFSKAPGTFLQ